MSNRRLVVEALSQIGDERVLKPLLTVLNVQDSHVQVAAMKALGQIRDCAARTLSKLLKDPIRRCGPRGPLPGPDLGYRLL
jgi:HEAT repeat protein